MIPSIVAHQLRDCVSDYFLTTFRGTSPGFDTLMERFIAQSDNVGRGPYVSVGLPFRSGAKGANYFPEIPLQFSPHLHQERAFNRLSPPYYQSTIVATGTGSGKTECFLLPLLEHCRQEAGKQGIKAILLYPMNALATDQAKRIAQLIDRTPSLKGRVTAGLYIGGEEDSPTAMMSPEQVITDKSILRRSPPDILLTNYKMLDYLLIQPETQGLWAFNQPETFRYLVVDEFHTFDGAQGTDLACLVRRLKYRLQTPKQHLACVGTSATLGGSESQTQMLAYAGQIFQESFDDLAIVQEDRLSAAEFLTDALLNVLPLPAPNSPLLPSEGMGVRAYLRQQAHLWLDDEEPTIELECADDAPLSEEWCIELGEKISTLPIVQIILKTVGEKTYSYTELLTDVLQKRLALPSKDLIYQQQLLDSLLSLVATARRRINLADGSSIVVPWVTLRVQFWLRELRRMVGSISTQPELLFSSDLTPPHLKKTLPIVHCRDCGATGWAGLRPRQGDRQLASNDLQSFYRAFFSSSPLVTYLFPTTPGRSALLDAAKFCPDCFRINLPTATKCLSCNSEGLIAVEIPDNTKNDTHQGQKQLVSTNDCPYCQSSSGLSILGAQAASLTSAMIGVLYTTPFNHDKKLLTFSDSVQDAAHRAGFYGARTYRTTLRTAIAHTIRNASTLPTLKTLVDDFPNYWQSKFTTTADYIATFLPADLVWLREWDDYIKGDKLELDRSTTLPKLLAERLTWEIVQQFGHRSAVGPSLERSASCSVSFDPATIDRGVAALHLRLTNEIEILRSVDGDRIRQFILGILHHLRQRGGILQPATENYITSGGNTFLWKKYTYMPPIGPRIPAPIFYVNATAKSDRFEQVMKPGKQFSWCEDWTERVFRDISLLILKEVSIDILHTTLTILSEVGLLQEKNLQEGGKAWGIPLTGLHLHSDGQVLVCDRCRHQLTASSVELNSLQQMTCMTKGCDGRYQIDPNNGLAYYRQLYHSGEVLRIVAADHTGLLARDNRELLEERFINGQRRCDPNLLSATSTLEMGINIGDLSTVLLCSVPPSTANFQQRVGRAGRRDGNALVSTIANVRPHDLYFYAEPEEMIAGNVTPAGCYLDASAILERQLTAFCLDRWVATGITVGDFPKALRDALSNLEKANTQRFPYNWLEYIHTRQAQLVADFEGLFDTELAENSRRHLRQFMEQGERDCGGLRWRIIDRLQSIQNERKRLVNQSKAITARIKAFKELPDALQQQDPDKLRELEIEKASFRQLIKEIDNKQILNFLTDEGLLPNYAFPEAGVTLRSIIWRKTNTEQDPSGKRYETSTLTYERPGALAIRELVPNSTFYAEGRQVRIDQIDLQLSGIEEWRMCRNCSCALQRTRPEFQAKSCPRCSDGMWSDSGRLRSMLRLRQVVATTADRDSRFGDDSEERNAAFFQRSLLVDSEPEYREQTYLVADPEFPFGFEYISRCNFREINLGEPSPIGEKVTLGGRNFNTRGFKICTGCGKVLKRNPTNQSQEHSIACKYRDKPDLAKIQDVLYLYREFESEAMRFLLPDETFWTTKGQSSFIAALQLGLKLKFGGQIDHLKVTISEEPQTNSNQRKSFLYLYDSVPGGTGYLKQLLRDPQKLRDVFQQALAHIRICPCEDGCYRCLFAYRNSFDLDETSRQTAISELAAILKHWPQLKENSQGLSAIRVNSNFESELERRFIEAIRRYRGIDRQQEPPLLKQDIINGKAGYYLKLGEAAWIIELQVSLGKNEGVNYPSRADFVFRPASSRSGSKPIAIFTDGWEYHRDRLEKDIQQRLAIVRTNNYWCWSITWDDVEAQIDPDRIRQGESRDGLNCALNPGFKANAEAVYQQYKCLDLRPLESLSSFDWLMAYLAHPEASQWGQWALMRTAAQANPQQNLPHWQQQIANYLGTQAVESWSSESKYIANAIEVSTLLKVWIGVDIQRHRQLDLSASLVTLILTDENLDPDGEIVHTNWVEMLRLANLYQFLPHFYWLTASMYQSGIVPPLVVDFTSADLPPETSTWAEIKSLMVADELIDAIDRMEAERWLLPEAGYELLSERQLVIGMAELAWLDAKIAIVLTVEDRAAFERSGWIVYETNDLNQELLTDIYSKLSQPR
ncbi:helicase family protein with metal-binding cysteine cluster [Chamaesiphon minutus PCC 6605]|uniref:Helicase family protein with metal-binding cysteine cluster n=2 Tax=Chamaesiphon TaxID=217161 RepID=K9UFA2_CHAP6|nr:helicase family protein with metal-binding cysteine cluster [Chamaesiphon minutus PCC 6605]